MSNHGFSEDFSHSQYTAAAQSLHVLLSIVPDTFSSYCLSQVALLQVSADGVDRGTPRVPIPLVRTVSDCGPTFYRMPLRDDTLEYTSAVAWPGAIGSIPQRHDVVHHYLVAFQHEVSQDAEEVAGAVLRAGSRVGHLAGSL